MTKSNTVHYAPYYGQSWGLIVGIDKYRNAPPLQTAVTDAKAVAEILKDKFSFAPDHVVVLLDENATRDEIYQEYMKFTDDSVGDDDRLFFYFAGHGFPKRNGNREYTFLVPVDGDSAVLASVLRLDSFLREADLMRPKHIFYVLDSCYSGAGLKRVVPPGETRFIENMIQRPGRQLLASGKANETVADGSGPRPNHSIFAGHLLNGLEGAARTTGDILTAQNLMAYVYNNVSQDLYSQQTPHYGWLDGDGDFVFEPLHTQASHGEPTEGKPLMVELAPTPEFPGASEPPAPVDCVLEYLADDKHRIKLDRHMAALWRELLPKISDDFFASRTEVNESNLTRHLKRHEDASHDLCMAAAAVARWGEDRHQSLLTEVAARSVEHIESKGGLVASLAMRYYPAILLTYVAGIAAVSRGKYGMMRAIFDAQVREGPRERLEPFVLAVGRGHLEIVRSKLFTLLPEHQRHYVPLSEYLCKALQPDIESLLSLGRRYEQIFDEWEIFYALVHADQDQAKTASSDFVRGPIGRFGWKDKARGGGGGPFFEIVAAAEKQQDDWPPIKANLFRSYQRFKEIADAYRTQVLDPLPWF